MPVSEGSFNLCRPGSHQCKLRSHRLILLSLPMFSLAVFLRQYIRSHDVSTFRDAPNVSLVLPVIHAITLTLSVALDSADKRMNG